MLHSELHYTSRHPTIGLRIRNWSIALLAVTTLAGAYALTDLIDRNAALSDQVAGFQSRGCPESFQGMRFSFSAFETLNLNRPKHARLACYYQKGTMS